MTGRYTTATKWVEARTPEYARLQTEGWECVHQVHIPNKSDGALVLWAKMNKVEDKPR